MRGLDQRLSQLSSSMTRRACHITGSWAPPQSFRFSGAGVGPENVHFYHISRNCGAAGPEAAVGEPLVQMLSRAVWWLEPWGARGWECESAEATMRGLSDPGPRLQGLLAKPTGLGHGRESGRGSGSSCSLLGKSLHKEAPRPLEFLPGYPLLNSSACHGSTGLL